MNLAKLSNLITKHAVFLISIFVTLFLFFLYINVVHAEGTTTELYMPTDVGFVVLTTEPCDLKIEEPTNLKYRAYATELGKPDHPGCWYLDESIDQKGNRFSAVAIYFPELNATALYNPKLFVKEKGLESF